MKKQILNGVVWGLMFLSTMVMGNMIKVVSWYDNEIGYSTRVVDLIQKISN